MPMCGAWRKWRRPNGTGCRAETDSEVTELRISPQNGPGRGAPSGYHLQLEKDHVPNLLGGLRDHPLRNKRRVAAKQPELVSALACRSTWNP
mmetsp:Transcript_31962/g.69991  ORF Transcript_31962/g.69991 Transcript_31962/m.69991 type:complete len:92 (+) Transcript_31962:231-506(+)